MAILNFIKLSRRVRNFPSQKKTDILRNMGGPLLQVGKIIRFVFVKSLRTKKKIPSQVRLSMFWRIVPIKLQPFVFFHFKFLTIFLESDKLYSHEYFSFFFFIKIGSLDDYKTNCDITLNFFFFNYYRQGVITMTTIYSVH